MIIDRSVQVEAERGQTPPWTVRDDQSASDHFDLPVKHASDHLDLDHRVKHVSDHFDLPVKHASDQLDRHGKHVSDQLNNKSTP
jgi:hypothetical protein